MALKVLDEWREHVGIKKLADEGNPVTVQELKRFILQHHEELCKNYNACLTMIGPYGISTSHERVAVVIRRHNPSGSIITIDRESDYSCILHIDFDMLQWMQDEPDKKWEYYSHICYSEADWIDIQFGHYVMHQNGKRFLSLVTLTFSPNLNI